MPEKSVLSQELWDFPISIHYGCGVRQNLPRLVKSAPMKAPLVVTDRGCSDLPFVSEILEHLRENGLRASLFSDVSSNPTDQEITEGISTFLTTNSDGVIALGGGSGMDTGKAISFLAAVGADKIWDYDFCNPSGPASAGNKLYPVICIPTTAGTGAEIDSGCIVTDTTARTKRCIFHPTHKPALALLDPELTLGLPANLTAWTGADALVHAIEAFVVPQFHPICDGIALQSMELITGALRRAVNDGTDIEARAAMLTGSCLGGIAFTKGLGLVHATSHMIGGVYDTHHGLTNAVMLPTVLQFNRAAIEHKVPAMCHALGLSGSGFDDFYAAIVQLLDEIDIPDSLAALGVDESSVEDIAKKTMTDLCLPTNPATVTQADVRTLLHGAIKKAR